jgi:protein SCO1/2
LKPSARVFWKPYAALVQPPTRIVLALLSLAALIAVIVAILLRGSDESSSPSPTSAGPASQFEGAALPLVAAAPNFTLDDQSGHAVSLRPTRGSVTVLSFLYADCGAPCVLIAQQIRGALDELKRPARVLIVSADPTADTRARVRRFLLQVSLTGRVSWLTAPRARLRSIWRAFDVTPASAGRVAFARMATVTLLDPQGRRRVLFGPEQLTPEALAHDIGRLDGEPAHP